MRKRLKKFIGGAVTLAASVAILGVSPAHAKIVISNWDGYMPADMMEQFTKATGIEAELAELREKSQGMKAGWQAEKDVIEGIQDSRSSVEELRVEAERATRTGDLNRAAEINYGEIPQAEEKIEVLSARLDELQKDEKFLKEEVETDDIAAVVAEWTGIPVTRLMESERNRLAHLEDHLGRRVIGQVEAVYLHRFEALGADVRPVHGLIVVDEYRDLGHDRFDKSVAEAFVGGEIGHGPGVGVGVGQRIHLFAVLAPAPRVREPVCDESDLPLQSAAFDLS